MAKKRGPISPEKIKLKQKVWSGYTMLHDIKTSELYGRGRVRDQIARDFISDKAPLFKINDLVPGQMLLFNYFTPKTAEELEYYDASPCTIFFNIIDTTEGKRILGFNIHYYPPKMRYKVLDRIFDIFRGQLKENFTTVQDKAVSGFDYHFLLDELDKAGLGFGVRMYIPNLIGDCRGIPVNMWKVAVFTEGWFKKATRAAIMKYWEQWANTHKTAGKRYKRRNRMKKKAKK